MQSDHLQQCIGKGLYPLLVDGIDAFGIIWTAKNLVLMMTGDVKKPEAAAQGKLSQSSLWVFL